MPPHALQNLVRHHHIPLLHEMGSKNAQTWWQQSAEPQWMLRLYATCTAIDVATSHAIACAGVALADGGVAYYQKLAENTPDLQKAIDVALRQVQPQQAERYDLARNLAWAQSAARPEPAAIYASWCLANLEKLGVSKQALARTVRAHLPAFPTVTHFF